MISYDDFAKIEIKVGRILSAEKIPDTDKLLKLKVDFGILSEKIIGEEVSEEATDAEEMAGEEVVTEKGIVEPPRDVRQIISGIAIYFPDPNILINKKCMFVTNLEPRKIKGFESNGMLFALSTDDGKFSLLEPESDIPEGTKAK